MKLKKLLPLRIGVGAVVLNKNNKVFVGKRKDNPVDKWQMPQGGVNEGIDGWSEYELPSYLLGKIWRGKYRGQKQKWFIVRFLGSDNEIDLEKYKPEFIEWRWLEIEKLPVVIVEFKRKIYEELLPKIRSYIN